MQSNRFVVLCIFLVVICFFSNFLLSCVAVSTVDRAKVTYEVTEKNFVSAVNTAVWNFMSNLVQHQTFEEKSEPERSQPEITFVSNMSTWLSPLRGYRMSIDGIEYGPGDYTKFGLLLKVYDGRAIVQKDDSLVILRPERCNAGMPQGARRAPAGPEDEAAPF